MDEHISNNRTLFKEVFEIMESKFTSGNNIDVERTTITRKEWEILKTGFCKCGIKKKS